MFYFYNKLRLDNLIQGYYDKYFFYIKTKKKFTTTIFSVDI